MAACCIAAIVLGLGGVLVGARNKSLEEEAAKASLRKVRLKGFDHLRSCPCESKQVFEGHVCVYLWWLKDKLCLNTAFPPILLELGEGEKVVMREERLGNREMQPASSSIISLLCRLLLVIATF